MILCALGAANAGGKHTHSESSDLRHFGHLAVALAAFVTDREPIMSAMCNLSRATPPPSSGEDCQHLQGPQPFNSAPWRALSPTRFGEEIHRCRLPPLLWKRAPNRTCIFSPPSPPAGRGLFGLWHRLITNVDTQYHQNHSLIYICVCKTRTHLATITHMP